MTEHKRLVENIQAKMAIYVSNLRISNDRDYFDENKEAEYFFCKPLSLLFDASVTNINSEKRNFPGIDLADRKEGISFQITSTNTKKKVQHTLDEFLEHKLDDDFDRLIVLIVTLDDPPKCANLKFKRPFDFDVKRDVWNISRLVQEFENLPFEKRHLLQAFSDYLDQELRGIDTQAPHLELPLYSTLQTFGFVGRQSELAEIRSRFALEDKLVVLTGLGGIGKTELAVQYGLTHSGRVHFTRFDGTFTRTLSNMAQGIRPALSDEQLRQDEKILSGMVLRILEKSDKQDLLIIDNADSPTGALSDLQKDSGYQALCRLPLGLLLTTRSHAPRAIPVGAMSQETLFEIFRKHGADLEKREMEELIDAVNGHTLTIDLIARTLNGRGLRTVTAEMMLKALRENTLPSEKYRKIATDYNQSTEQAQIYQHLSTVFDMSRMSEDEKALLRTATLFPENGIDGDLIASVSTEEQVELYETLIGRGWLEKKGSLLTIHPVIRLVCRAELNPSDENCEDFLDRLWAKYDQKQFNHTHYCQMAELFTFASDTLCPKHGRWINRSAILWNEVRHYQKLCDLYHARIPILERNLPSDSEDLATAYNYYGVALAELGQYPQSLEYGEKALAIRKIKLDENDPDLGCSYNNVGIAYGGLGNHQKALHFKLFALEIFKKSLGEDHPDLATSYSHVGGTYGDMGYYYKALEHQLIAKEIRERIFPKDHLTLSESYNALGHIYRTLSDYNLSLAYSLRAMEIREKTLPKNHPHLASSYNNVGISYCDLGQHEKALPFLSLALERLEEAYPNGHPNIDATKNNIQQCQAAIRMKQNMMASGIDLAKPLGFPQLPPFRK